MAGKGKIIFTGPSPRGWHRLQQAAECLQKYAWQYEVESKEDDKKTAAPLLKGTLLHLALAQHYARMRAAQNLEGSAQPAGGVPDLASLGQEKDTPEAWCPPEDAVYQVAEEMGAEAYADDVVEAYREYARQYADDMHQWKILAIEELADTRVAGRYRLTGRLDLLVEDTAGRVFAIDHKSTGRLTARHSKFYAMSGQLIGYAYMARKLYGERFAGLIVNLVEIKKGPKSMQRVELARSPFLESRFEQTVIDIEESIERMQASGRDPSDWPKAMNELTCFHRYGACDFTRLCRWGPDAPSVLPHWEWSDT